MGIDAVGGTGFVQRQQFVSPGYDVSVGRIFEIEIEQGGEWPACFGVAEGGTKAEGVLGFFLLVLCGFDKF